MEAMKGHPPFESAEGEPPPPSQTNPFDLIQFALRAGGVQVVNFGATVKRVQGAQGKALLVVEAPAGVGDNLKGPPEDRDFFLLIHIPRAAGDEFDRQMSSPIVLAPPTGGL